MKKTTTKPASKPIPTKRGKAAKPAAQAKPKKGPGSGKPNAIQKAQAAAQADPSLALWQGDPEADKAEHGHGGRPTVYTPTIGARILAWIASGQKMATLWTLPGIPSEPLFYKWLSREGEEYDRLREGLARARETRAASRPAKMEAVADRLVDAPTAGELPLHPQAAKVYLDAQRTLMELEAPRKYGKAITLRGDPESPLESRTRHEFSQAELEAILRGGVDEEAV